jgi:FOG: WD40-like repeat
VYIGSTDGKVYSFGASTGKLRWSHSTGGYVYASPAVWNGLVFAGSYSGRFYAFDAATGAERWSFDAHGPISGSATVIGTSSTSRR